MGSPISPVIAESFLQSFELSFVKNNKDIIFWRRYVDDVFAIIRARKKVKLLQNMNSFHHCLQFTTEEEVKNKLSFMDVMTYEKPDKSMGHFIYRKDTHTNNYLNYGSFHPQAHKLGVTDTLLTRAFRLSDAEHLQEEVKFTTQVLEENGYPRRLIQQRIKNVKYKIDHNIRKSKDIEKRIILPWAGNVTNKIARYLQNKLQIEIGYFPGPKLCRMLCNAKEKIEVPQSGIYSISCKSCPAKYIEETERNYKTRIKEHEHAITSCNTKISPVALHVIQNNHVLDSSSFKLIAREPRKFFRKFKEAIHIRSLDNKMNISKGLSISQIWSATLVPFLKFSNK